MSTSPSCVEVVIPNRQLGGVAAGVATARIDDHGDRLVGVEARTHLAAGSESRLGGQGAV